MIRRRGPDRAGRGAELENVLSPGVLDLDRRVQTFGLGANVILPGDTARLRLEGHDETATGETLVVGAKIPDPLFEWALPATTTLPSARMGEANVPFSG